MKTFSNHSFGVDQGDIVLFSDFEEGGEMWTGQGPRQKRQTVSFSRPFLAKPVVHAGLAMWDMDSANNLRADLITENVTEEGFDLVFKTWGDTRVARVRVTWMAMGPVINEDDWELY